MESSSANKLTQEAAKHYGPEYPFVTRWEEDFDFEASVEFMKNNWHLPFIFAIGLYLPILYIFEKIMLHREPMKLRKLLIIWNFALAIFSMIGFSRVLPEMIFVIRKFGFQHSICNNSFRYVKPVCFWIYLFVLSKFPELIDTMFLVAKKQKLIFLHVYHHSSVVLFAWFVWSGEVAASRWYTTMNFGVHSIMYLYYGLKALPNFVRIPKWVSMLITSLQTLQMVMGTYVVSASFYSHLIGQDCATSMPLSVLGLVIYGTYLVLFSHFFYKAYIAPTPRDKLSIRKKQT